MSERKKCGEITKSAIKITETAHRKPCMKRSLYRTRSTVYQNYVSIDPRCILSNPNLSHCCSPTRKWHVMQVAWISFVICFQCPAFLVWLFKILYELCWSLTLKYFYKINMKRSEFIVLAVFKCLSDFDYANDDNSCHSVVLGNFGMSLERCRSDSVLPVSILV